ncbi:MAG: hypothetical protein KIT14_14875 [bacterium]|nr:hypothetical protein [bacterium]
MHVRLLGTALITLTLGAAALGPAAPRPRYLGVTSGLAPSSLVALRWAPEPCAIATPCWSLRARYRCRRGPSHGRCPGRTGLLRARTAHPGDFAGTLRIGRRRCTVSGSLTTREPDVRLWETAPPADAPRVVVALTCGEADDGAFGFIGETAP